MFWIFITGLCTGIYFGYNNYLDNIMFLILQTVAYLMATYIYYYELLSNKLKQYWVIEQLYDYIYLTHPEIEFIKDGEVISNTYIENMKLVEYDGCFPSIYDFALYIDYNQASIHTLKNTLFVLDKNIHNITTTYKYAVCDYVFLSLSVDIKVTTEEGIAHDCEYELSLKTLHHNYYIVGNWIDWNVIKYLIKTQYGVSFSNAIEYTYSIHLVDHEMNIVNYTNNPTITLSNTGYDKK